ncbi:TetR/AcrR family transcriptional regulator [Actinomadura madurae]|uniref:TetR/AcrR family transcriptional regulator n=1 Tax=Actinomadura madurae TaxID=1993 RepID=UPI0020D2468D|nr:TetR/AcrR family transcriptional regulator [Actinomadura madurae]MCP9949826.1 TetR/AcrR family transcriptional regulator [Actinomadura madurae]MCP9979069.1 TetR/AcrR family transcriptional regulator [Actinomadura madurae]MCQ0009406.1 TetR/AcrR family transcriptional regulator [Actinomadura madurae]MCQ0015252.1 TetR/AcrR family transcriptional regulator [Actinomadura madurae]
MHSADKTARTEICDQALRLFAANGPDNVSLRQVAAAAEVSPSLVVHHFGGKAGLREAVNERSLAVFRRFVESVVPSGAGGEAVDDFLPRRLVAFLPTDSPVLVHLCRLLMSDEPAGRQIFRRWHELKLAWLDAVAGAARPGEDRSLRAAWLTVNELAVLLQRHQLHGFLGRDPLDPEEAARWARVGAEVYRDGIRAEIP